MMNNKQELIKLINFIVEISNIPDNSWFKNDLVSKLMPKSLSQLSHKNEINEIHEYCIKQILQEQARMFYKDFKLFDINDILCKDYVRMEQFRREDNFEEFCLAMFQQIEQIVNTLSNSTIESYVRENWNTYLLNWKDKRDGSSKGKLLWQFVLNFNMSHEDIITKINKPITDWDFNLKYKSVLIFYYFNKTITNYKDFDLVSNSIYELYQVRNLNHRGGKKTPKQVEVTGKIAESKSRYYFKFLGIFEDFVSKVNCQIN